MSNIISIAGSNSKSNKGDGINAVLTLMKDLRDFQDKVEAGIEAQAITENREKLEVFYDKLDEMAVVLLGIAEVGMKRKVNQIDEDVVDSEVDVVDEEEVEESRPVSAGDRLDSMDKIQMLNTPVIPRIPR